MHSIAEQCVAEAQREITELLYNEEQVKTAQQMQESVQNAAEGPGKEAAKKVLTRTI